MTGAAIARAVEPEHAEGRAVVPGDCLNCGTLLIGAHCHNCGQKANVHRTLTAFWHDLAHGVLHFEGKVWHTLPLLFVKPGELTRRYIHGERARFVSPLALFLFVVFLMFAVLSLFGSGLDSAAIGGNARREVNGNMAQGSIEVRKEVAELDAKIKAAEAKGRDTAKLRRERSNIDGFAQILDGKPAVFTDSQGRRIDRIRTGWDRLDSGIAKANANPGLLLYKLQSNAYKFSWMLIPISVPFVWLLFFWRREFRVYDHAIFVTYSLSFMMLLGIILSVGGIFGLPGVVIGLTAMLAPPLHMYKQLRGTYGVSRAGALLRTLLLLGAGGVVVIMFWLLLLAMGLSG